MYKRVSDQKLNTANGFNFQNQQFSCMTNFFLCNFKIMLNIIIIII